MQTIQRDPPTLSWWFRYPVTEKPYGEWARAGGPVHFWSEYFLCASISWAAKFLLFFKLLRPVLFTKFAPLLLIKHIHTACAHDDSFDTSKNHRSGHTKTMAKSMRTGVSSLSMRWAFTIGSKIKVERVHDKNLKKRKMGMHSKHHRMGFGSNGFRNIHVQRQEGYYGKVWAVR